MNSLIFGGQMTVPASLQEWCMIRSWLFCSKTLVMSYLLLVKIFFFFLKLVLYCKKNTKAFGARKFV
jgi:hypothetical protein